MKDREVLEQVALEAGIELRRAATRYSAEYDRAVKHSDARVSLRKAGLNLEEAARKFAAAHATFLDAADS